MSRPLIVTYLPLLEAINRIKNKKVQRLVLKQLKKDRAIVKCFREIALNTINHRIKLTTRDKRRLNKHSRVIRALSSKRSIEQSGGFLNVVLPILAGVVSDLLLKR